MESEQKAPGEQTPEVPASQPNIFQRGYTRTEAHVKANPRRTSIIVGSVLLLIVGFWIKVPEPHVSLSGEPLLVSGPEWLQNWLTNSVLTTMIVDLIIIVLALAATMRMKVIPSGVQNFVEIVMEYLYNLSESVAGKDARKYFPWVVTIFLFVIFSNWSGLIPGVGSIGFIRVEEESTESEHARALDRQLAMPDGNLLLVAAAAEGEEGEEGHAKFVPLFRAPSADLNVTFALAIITMVMVQFWGVQALGASYFGMFFTFSGVGFMRWINAFVGILELISQFARVIAFGFRLFGNIFAGEIVLATMAFLITFWLPVPFYVLELFVGFVQALVFMMLALVFFSMATISHSHDHEH